MQWKCGASSFPYANSLSLLPRRDSRTFSSILREIFVNGVDAEYLLALVSDQLGMGELGTLVDGLREIAENILHTPYIAKVAP